MVALICPYNLANEIPGFSSPSKLLEFSICIHEYLGIARDSPLVRKIPFVYQTLLVRHHSGITSISPKVKRGM